MELLLPFFIFASYINSLENILSCKRTFIHDTLIIEEQHIGNLGNPKKIYFRVDDKLTKFTSVNIKRSKFSDEFL